MAKYRQVHVSFWDDVYVSELTPERKYFLLYLMTNPHTTQCGIYEITERQMVFETGYNRETVQKLVEYFEDQGKIKYSRETKEICIVNWPKYNYTKSPKVVKCIEKELLEVKNSDLIEYLKIPDRVSIDYTKTGGKNNNNKKNNNNNNKDPYCYGDPQKWQEGQDIDHVSFVDAFNELYDRQLRVTDSKRENIRSRLRTFTGAEIKKAWENREHDEWLNSEGSKFLGDWKAAMRNDEKIDKYLNQKTNGTTKDFKPQIV